MQSEVGRIKEQFSLPQIRQIALPTVADQVFDALQKHILSLELPPGCRISETEVASKMGVSRQPVREAFKRLAKLGFLHIRPQSSTTVSLISEEAIMKARFIRIALEVQTCRTACRAMGPQGHAVLAELIQGQKDAVEASDRNRFHALDDQFHREICVQSGVGYVWDLIHENKAHMDRVRLLTLNSSSQRFALDEHIKIYEAIVGNRPDAVADAVKQHLSRIDVLIKQIKAENHSWFAETV